MKIYKRGIISLVKSLIIAVVSGLLVWFILFNITKNQLVVYGIPSVILLILIHMALTSENIKFEIHDGKLKYYQKNRLKKLLILKNYYIGYNAKATNGSVDYINLHFTKNNEDDHYITIECTSLGMSKFLNMYEELKKVCKEYTPKINVKKQGERE